MENHKTKLYHRAGKHFALPQYIGSDGQPCELPADFLPLIHWPDGRTCFDASMYMLELYERGLSRLVGGGTLLTYATKLSHLLRFAAKNNIDVLEVTDSYFSLFINSLRAERKPSGARVRTNSTVISIGRICLDFVDWLAGQYGQLGYVSNEGSIRATRKEHTVIIKGGRSKTVRYWDHASFGAEEAFKQRVPISAADVSLLRQAVVKAKSSPFVRRRRQVMLKLLEVTGGRRTEVAMLTVTSVHEAARMKEPALRLRTLKKRGGKVYERLVPISAHDLHYLCEYIRLNRAPMLKKLGLRSDCEDALLISETSGRGLFPNTITQEVFLLRKIAGIKGSACSHMFRHRFLTKAVVALLEQHKIQNPDSFRQALIDHEGLKTRLLEISGHSSIDSLDRYVDLACEELTKLAVTFDLVKARLSIMSFLGTAEEIGLELDRGGSTELARNRLHVLLSAIASELRQIKLDDD